jgi:hypothetical protein
MVSPFLPENSPLPFKPGSTTTVIATITLNHKGDRRRDLRAGLHRQVGQDRSWHREDSINTYHPRDAPSMTYSCPSNRKQSPPSIT